MPIIGLEYISGDTIKIVTETSEIKYDGGFFGFRAGVDLTGIFQMTKTIAIFTNLGMYYDTGNYYRELITKIKTGTGAYDYERNVDDDDYSCSGWTFAPSIGVSLTFGR